MCAQLKDLVFSDCKGTKDFQNRTKIDQDMAKNRMF